MYSRILSKTCLIKDLSIIKKYYVTNPYSIALLPDTEKLLDSLELKHRKHPGTRKLPPIKLPAALINSVLKLIDVRNEAGLRKEAKKLLSFLTSRRQPLEQEEIRFRLQRALPESLDEFPEKERKDIVGKAHKMILAEAGRWKPLEYTSQVSLTYLVARLCANYASVYKVLSEIKKADPSFTPKTLFDFGSGLGSATWAANTLWKEDIAEYFCVDASQNMNDLCLQLMTDEQSGEPIMKPIYFRQFLPASNNLKYDLIISAFSLMDLSTIQERIRVIDTLWRKTNDILVVIELGNNSGFQAVLDARDYILEVENQPVVDSPCHSTGAHVMAPCPHDSPCPLIKDQKKSPCGFFVSYESIFPRFAHELRKDWISYVVLRKGPRQKDMQPWPRIVKPVQKKDKHVYCHMCCDDGLLKDIVITRKKHGRHLYRCARSSKLGDLLPVNIQWMSDQSDSSLDFPESSDSDEDEENVI